MCLQDSALIHFLVDTPAIELDGLRQLQVKMHGPYYDPYVQQLQELSFYFTRPYANHTTIDVFIGLYCLQWAFPLCYLAASDITTTDYRIEPTIVSCNFAAIVMHYFITLHYFYSVTNFQFGYQFEHDYPL